MALRLVGTSSQKIEKASAPISAAPFTLGIWLRPTSTGTGAAFNIDNGSATNRFTLFRSAETQWEWSARVTTNGTATLNVPNGTNQWIFLLGRMITSTNRRVSAVCHDGTVAHAVNTTDKAPASLTVTTLGAINAGSYFTGLISEFWMADADIQADGGQLNDALLRQLAFRGPFSVPRIKRDIVEYRSFRDHPTHGREIYFRRDKGIQTWTNTNGVTLGLHPQHAVPWNPQYVGSGADELIVPAYVPDALAGTAAITGTAAADIDEDDVVAGGKTIIITLTDDTWAAAGATFDAQRQAIIDGLDSAQIEATGWNAEVRDNLAVTDVVRTSDTVVTITLSAQAAYDITATETITVTVPAAAVEGGVEITAAPTFTVDEAGAGAGTAQNMLLLGVGD